jgi:hypothetical protein
MYILNQTVLLRVFLILILVVSLVTNNFSQVTDSASTPTRIVYKDSLAKKHSPKKATIMSVCLPGLGQVYNKKYWKVPVMYVGFAALGYALVQTQSLYANYRDAYIYRTDNNPATVDKYVGIYSNDDLLNIQQQYHRDRDLSVIGLGLLYMVNIIDASVDAHLFTFDVSDNLSLNIRPNLLYIASANHYQTGLSLNFKFQ